MTKPQITYDDFTRIEMRVGRIAEIQLFPRARKPSYKVAVDFGEATVRWSSAQITNYPPEDLYVTNMPKRNIAGFRSEILIMGAPGAEGCTMHLQPDRGAIVGSQVF